jgi:hypothetical protein
MTTRFTEARVMAGRRKKNMTRDRMELKAEPEWIARLTRVAKKLGLSLSAYVRLALTEDMDDRESRWKEQGIRLEDE